MQQKQKTYICLPGSVITVASLKSDIERRFAWVCLHSAIGIISLVTLLSAPCIRAQTIGTGAITGTVLDTSGAVIPGATVTAVNPATGYSVSQKTSSAGAYMLASLPPSHYTVTIRAAGFTTFVQEDVIVDALTTVGLNPKLKVGTASETVTVSALPPQLDTTSGSLQLTIPNSTYTALPLAMNGGPKDITGFVTLMPGTRSAGSGPAFNGGAQASNAIYLNGMSVGTPYIQGQSLPVTAQNSTEVVDQFQVITSGVPAYYSGQGITNFVLKSGTNSFHGDVYENLRNTVFDAAGYFSTVTPIERQHEFGGTLGGPILKNRLFFFGNYDGYRLTQTATPALLSIPTMAERTGDFSALPVTIYDPATTSCTSSGKCTRQPFPNNIIPANRVSSISKSLQSYLPVTTNSALASNYLAGLTGSIHRNMYVGKVDWNLSQKNHAYALVEYGKQTYPSIGGKLLPLPYTNTQVDDYDSGLIQIGDTEELTENLVNIFSYQINRLVTEFGAPTAQGNYADKAGLTGIPSGLPMKVFPKINFNGPNSPIAWGDSTSSQLFNTINAFQDNLQWIHGRHAFTFGTYVTIQGTNLVAPSIITGITFASRETAGFTPAGGLMATTGNAYASYLLGEVDTASLQDNSYVSELGDRYRDYAFYAQDDWKITPRFTANLGLRYQIAKPLVDVHNHSSWLNPNLPNPAVGNYPGALQFAGYGPSSCHCRTQVETHYLAFDPRIGFAYSVNNKMVIRGSYSVVHFNAAALGGGDSSRATGQLGYQATPSFTTPNAGITPAFSWNSGFPSYQLPPFIDPTLNSGYNTTTGPNGGSIQYSRPDTAGEQPTTQNWNLTLQQQLNPTIVWSLSYSGSKSRKLPLLNGYGIYSNQLQPKYLALGSLLQATETPATLAKAQAIFPDITLPYSTFSGSIGQMLKPFPQYSSIQDPYADFGSANYNSLQTYLQKTMSNGLSFLFSYTWSKEIDNSGEDIIQFQTTGGRSAYNLGAERSVGINDRPHVISLAYVYALPFGQGHWIGSQRRWVNTLIGGWLFSGIQQYASGTPLGTIKGACLVPYAGGCYADYKPGFSGSARINGSYGSGQPKGANPPSYININAFQSAASYTFGNTPRTMAYGLRNSWNLNEDISLTKNFKMTESATLQLRAAAFNVFNRTIFGGIATNIVSANFGTVSTQTNGPRNLQFEAYVRF